MKMSVYSLKVVFFLFFLHKTYGDDEGVPCTLETISTLPNLTLTAGQNLELKLKAKGNPMNILSVEIEDEEQRKINFQNLFDPNNYQQEKTITANSIIGPEVMLSIEKKTSLEEYDITLTIKSVSQFESEKFKVEVTFYEPTDPAEQKCKSGQGSRTQEYNVTVAQPPTSLEISGLESSIDSDNVQTKTINCVASCTRPEPTSFEWRVDGVKTNKYINSTDQIIKRDVMTEGQCGDIPGLLMTVTSTVNLNVFPDLDAKEVSCEVDHMGYNSTYTEEMKTVRQNVTVVGKPPSSNDTIMINGAEEEFVEGEPATIYVPFHSNPEPERVYIKPADASVMMVGKPTQDANSEVETVEVDTSGRYTLKKWIVENDKPVRSANEKQFYAVLEISELEEEDMDRVHTMVVENPNGNGTLTFKVPTIEDGGLSGGAIAGIVIGVLAGVTLIAVGGVMAVRMKNKRKSRKIKEDRKRRRKEEGRVENPGYDH